jgi:hypothetical protein
MPTEIRGRPANELSAEISIDPDLQDHLDHKGRSKPLYARRSMRPPPGARRLHPALDFVLGFFPGARMMAREQVVAGLAYAAIGLLCLIPGLLVTASWSTRRAQIEALGIDAQWLLPQAILVISSVVLFELLRFVSSMDRIRGRLRTARALASLALPALAVVLGGPAVIALGPGIIEPLWLGAWLVAMTALIAAADCLPTRSEEEASGGWKLALGGAATFVVLALIGLGVLLLKPATTSAIRSAASEAGFQIVPQLLAFLS